MTTCYADILKRVPQLAAIGLPIFTLATTALAENDMTYAGAGCRQLNPTFNIQDPTSNTFLLDVNGAMLNSGKNDQTWICPIVRDNVDKDAEFARITVLETGLGRVSCTFEVRDTKGLNGESVSIFDNKEEEVISTNPLQIRALYSYATRGTILTTSPFHGYYFFKCLVPGRGPELTGALAGVVTYIVSEQD